MIIKRHAYSVKRIDYGSHFIYSTLDILCLRKTCIARRLIKIQGARSLKRGCEAENGDDPIHVHSSLFRMGAQNCSIGGQVGECIYWLSNDVHQDFPHWDTRILPLGLAPPSLTRVARGSPVSWLMPQSIFLFSRIELSFWSNS